MRGGNGVEERREKRRESAGTLRRRGKISPSPYAFVGGEVSKKCNSNNNTMYAFFILTTFKK